MTFAPTLARSVPPERLETYISDPKFWFEQKLDGRRLLLKVEDGVVEATNRGGKVITGPPELSLALQHLSDRWYFDGEWIQGEFWVFDMPYAMDLITPESPYQERREALENVFEVAFGEADLFRLVDVSKTSAEKRSLVDWCRENESEGVMVKALAGKYHPGRRTEAMLKMKFTDTADCILGEVRREGKLSSSLYMIHEGDLVEIGSVKMTERDLDKGKTGDVVEVRYLYCTKDLRLYQPVFLKFRDDKSPAECTTENLQFVNKTIREVESKQRTVR